ncbi:MAG: RICIN domain-containing protein, partial [Bacilli bacterium]
ASATSGISKYEFSKDNGATWVNNGTSNTYTFTGLTHKTAYNIKSRVTSGVGRQTSSATVATTTNTVPTPTYSQTHTSTGKTVTITYPSGCGSTYTCTYTKSGGSAVTVKSTTAAVAFTASGNVVAKVSDGTNTVTASTYTVSITTSTITVNSTLGGSVTVANTTKGTSVTSSNATKKTITAINGDSIKVTTSLSSGFSTYSLKRGSTSISSGNVSTMGTSAYTVAGVFRYTSKPYKILTAINNTYGIVFDSGEGKGANAQLYNASQSQTQYWNLVLKKVENNIVYYGIESNYSGTRGWYLDIYGDYTVIKSGSNAEVWNAWADETDFYWYLRDAGSGYFYIVNKLGYCLDVYDGKATNGANVWVYTCNNTTAQKWKFVA